MPNGKKLATGVDAVFKQLTEPAEYGILIPSISCHWSAEVKT
jgi:hypothetical protein